MTRPQTKTLTAACCIIGDEILNGKTRDSNAHFLSKYLFDLGIELKRIEVIPDDYDAIAESAKRLSDQHDVVFTSGGIGPTHDDITYPALARAFGLGLKEDKETCQRMEAMSSQKPGWSLTEARRRMALFPMPSRILRCDDELWVPVVIVNDNVHILPGIPRLFERLLESMRPHLTHLAVSKTNRQSRGFFRASVATGLMEGDIAASLAKIQRDVESQQIKIGSYPNWIQDATGARVVVSIVGADEALVHATGERVATAVQGWSVDNVDNSKKIR